MKFQVWVMLVMGRLGAGVARRGPHHPRGEAPIVRHQHHKPRDQPLTQDSELLHDTKHLAEDTQALSRDALDAMSPEELEFHYFSAHDFDTNNKLDGLELLKAVYHTMEHQDNGSEEPLELEYNDIDAYIELVDRTLKSDDTDGDGYVSYAEYRAVRDKRPRPLDRDAKPRDPTQQVHDQAHQEHEKDAPRQGNDPTHQGQDLAHQDHQSEHKIDELAGSDNAVAHQAKEGGHADRGDGEPEGGSQEGPEVKLT